MERLSLATLFVFHGSSAFSCLSVPGRCSSLTCSTSSNFDLKVAPKCSTFRPPASIPRFPSILSATVDRETASSDISTYGRIFPSIIVEPQIPPLGSGCDENNIFDKDEPNIITNSVTSDNEDQKGEDESNVQDSHESNNEENADNSDNDNEGAKRRTKAAVLKKLAARPSSPNRSRKNVSESKERSVEKGTSVGERRVGAASRARSSSGRIGNLLGSVRTSAAAAAAALREKKKNQHPSSSKDQELDGDTNAINKKSIVSTIDSLIDAQVDTKYYTKQPSIGLLGERIYYNYPSPRQSQPHKLHRSPQHKQKQQQVSLSTLPKPGTVVMQQKQQLAKHSLLAKQHLRKHFSITVAGQRDYAAIAELRLSVYGGHGLTWKKEWIDRTCEILNQRRIKGITCLTACVNYVDSGPWLIGSIECSTHEFEGTALGMRRPPGTILYITEVAVSNKVRRSGIGLSLLKAMDKIAAIRNVETLYLHVDVENIVARRLYEKSGYEILEPTNENEMYTEFTRKLNLHHEGITGRHHYLMQKNLTPTQTWGYFEPDEDTSKTHRGTLGFDV